MAPPDPAGVSRETVGASAQTRLRELGSGSALPPAFADQMGVVLALLAREPASITTVRDPLRAVDVHVADSLAALELAAVRDAGAIVDLGAGGGFPGLALAAALPRARVTLVESVGRKCAFMRAAIEAARLSNAQVVHARAEEWSDGEAAADVVTARALAPLGAILEYAAPLLTPGGRLVAYKAGVPAPEREQAAAAAELLGMSFVESRGVDPFPGAGPRSLWVYLKSAPTPDRFPRRAGMARKRPLGAAGRARNG